MTENSISLIGMSGVGKTTLGKALAKDLGWSFVDTDKMIVDQEKESIKHIISTRGEAAFHVLEAGTVSRLSNSSKQVISTGGSIIYSDKAMTLLKGLSTVVYLYEDPKVILSRLSGVENRGIIGLNGSTSYEDIWHTRDPIYRKYADAIVSFEGRFHVPTLVALIKEKVF